MKALAMVFALQAPADPAAAGSGPSYEKDLRPLLARYCFDCHSGPKAKVGIDLDAFRDEASVLRSRKPWQKVWRALHAREMPPEDRPQPSAAERDRLTDWIEGILRRPDPGWRRDPGPVLLRRLTRAEYSNCVAELVPSAAPRRHRYFDPAKGFPQEGLHLLHYQDGPVPLVADLPPDEADHGFDNQGDVLTLSPMLMEKYVQAAVEVLDGAGQDGRVFLARPGPGMPPRDAARRIVAPFARKAFRRPVGPEELERLLNLYDLAVQRGDPFEAAVKVALQAVLVSPHFLLKVERSEGPLSSHERAARLAFFLWNSLPDDELSRLADQDRLRDPQEWERQVRRMLRSPKAKALSDNFAMQWLQLSAFETLMPDPALFPVFYSPGCQDLQKWMRIEARLFFEAILIEDRSVLEFVDADWAILNANLAEFYGLAHFSGRVYGGGKEVGRDNYWWRRYKLPDGRRGGVLTMAAVLTKTSLPTRTSPVNRGKWILETILNAPPPPPPPNAGTLSEDDGPAVRRSVRDRLERHRRDPNCAGCHRRMDPLGLALENFDGIGRWRDVEGPTPPRDGPEQWDFNVDGHFEGWSFGHYGGAMRVQGGRLVVPVTHDTVKIFGPSMAKSAAQNRITIRLKNGTAAKQLRLEFLRPSEIRRDNMGGIPQGWRGDQSLGIPIAPRSDWADYTFDLSKHPRWKDEIAGLALSASDAKGEIEIDWIRMGGGPPAPPPPGIDAAGMLPNGRTVAGPAELKRRLVQDHRDDVVRGFTSHLLTYALGRPLDYYDTPVVQDIARAAAADGYRFSRVVLEVARSYPFLNRRFKKEADHD
ncbi:MAG TPA: DUF1592 domain-containing protein [Planctomycetota bacterium]|nr:DUF1592 domain-containing protein [Planctomycetota bacterium]